MRKTVRVTVGFVNAATGERDSWTEYVECPADMSSDKVFTRCEANMKRHGYATLGGSYQVHDGGALGAMIAGAR